MFSRASLQMSLILECVLKTIPMFCCQVAQFGCGLRQRKDREREREKHARIFIPLKGFAVDYGMPQNAIKGLNYLMVVEAEGILNWTKTIWPGNLQNNASKLIGRGFITYQEDEPKTLPKQQRTSSGAKSVKSLTGQANHQTASQ